jgi:hypothetical protein
MHAMPLLLLAAAIFVAPGCQVTRGNMPTNRELIASMPDDFRSVVILDAEPLCREGCGLKSALQRFFGQVDESVRREIIPDRDFLISPSGSHNLESIVFRELINRNPTKRVVAATWSPRAQGRDKPFRYLTIWITKNSNRPIKTKVKDGDGIIGEVGKTAEDGLDIYDSVVELYGGLKKIFVAFPNEHMTIVAFSSDDITHIAKSLKTKPTAIPACWQKASSTLNVESPVVMLRKFASNETRIVKPDPENPRMLKVESVAIDSCGITSDAGPKVNFKLRVITTQPDDAEIYFYGGGFYFGFPPGDWEWAKETDAEGFTADIELVKERKPEYTTAMVMTLSGICW